MATTNGVNNNTISRPSTFEEIKKQANSYTEKRSPPSTDLDKNAFLKVLMAQMQYQDPLEPVSDTQFIAQMAQFTSLEQAQLSNANSEATRAQNLIGKEIAADAIMGSDGTPVSAEIYGLVEGCVKIKGENYLLLDSGYLIPIARVVGVYDPIIGGGAGGEGDGEGGGTGGGTGGTGDKDKV